MSRERKELQTFHVYKRKKANQIRKYRMSDEPRRPRRRRSISRPRGERSKSSPREDDSWTPNLEFLHGYQYGRRRGSFKDGAEKGFADGYHARRSQKAVNEAKYDTDDDYDDEIDTDREDTEMKRQNIMDDIEKLTQPDGKLTKENLKQLVDEYKECDHYSSDEGEDEDEDDDDYDSSDDDTEDEEDNSDTDYSDKDSDKDEKDKN